MKRRAAIVVLWGPGVPSEPKQWAELIKYCAAEQIEPVALVRRDPAAAVHLAEAGHVELVVAPFDDRARILSTAEVEVAFIRPPRAGAQTAEQRLVLRMLARGGTPEVVAQLLDVPLADVRRYAGEPAEPNRRPVVSR